MNKSLLSFLFFTIFICSYEIYTKTNRSERYFKEMQKYRDMYNETMTDLSFCYSEMANETHKLTNSNRELYKLRTWIRECKPICRGERK